jgi:hypothetical protein
MADRTSLVPHFTFPGTLEEQEAVLATNPLMQRLIESRATYADDPHRPTVTTGFIFDIISGIKLDTSAGPRSA